uniref:BZIP domain-containing protein n=1 Tax=Kalanchoe fedtschenkoi TaxID=63787 RepID=A0A7N0UY03_KALFE
MGTDLNFGGFGRAGGGGGGSAPVGRQTSVYSLTLDELQSSVGGSLGKDFGSMNMDELLKNIWTAEEMQTMTTSCSGAAQMSVGASSGGGLQKQGSLTLPRTLSQKTVGEVWKDVHKEYGAGKDGTWTSVTGLQQRQQSLKEITLEEFLVRAGVVREDLNVYTLQALANSSNNGGPLYSDHLKENTNKGTSGHGIGFPSAAQGLGLTNQVPGAGNQIHVQAPILPLNVNGARSSQQPVLSPQTQKKPQLFPKLPGAPGYTGQMDGGVQLASPRIRGGLVGMPVNTTSMVQGSGMGMVGLGTASMNMVNESSPNQLSSDGAGKSNGGDLTSVSPVPYMFSGGIRGRRVNGAMEKVVERRQRRMIKNRESAARSRARKQAYTMELEAEVAKLKAENQELQRKQEVLMKLQDSQVMESMPPGPKRQCLRRVQSSPW